MNQDVAIETKPLVAIDRLSKKFRRRDGSTVNAIDDVSLDIAPGEFIVLLGPSGCGKTTLLRTIAGLETAQSGSISLNGKVVYTDGPKPKNVPTQRRGLSMVFQSYGLWPHMTVRKNIEFPLKSRIAGRARLSRAEIDERVDGVLRTVGLESVSGQYPSQISGGQQQRVALARAIVSGTNLVLFDEPLSNVDARVREQLRLGILRMQREFGFAAVYVTHDQAEAMELADRIVVLKEGRIEQIGVPRDVYLHPRSQYVADFMGSMNQTNGVIRGHRDGLVEVETPLGVFNAAGRALTPTSGDVVAMWRPESTQLNFPTNSFLAQVRASLFLGTHTEHILDASDTTVRVWTPDRDDLVSGTTVSLGVRAEDVLVLPRTAETQDSPPARG